MWAGVVMAAALVLTGCSQSGTSVPAETTAPTSATPSPVAESSSDPSTLAATASAAASPTQATLETHQIANGHFQITMPSPWRLEELTNIPAQVHQDSTASFKIMAADARQLAEIRTGGVSIFDINPMNNTAKNTVFDVEGEDTFGDINFAFLSYEGQSEEAEMMLTALQPASAKNWGTRLPGLIYTGGSGNINTVLTSQTKLPGVADSLKGVQRFQAYATTDEYSQLKKAMLSFQQLKDITPAEEEAPAGGQCIGARFSYELGDSELSCQEAKTFLTLMLEEPIHAGTVGRKGVGTCTVAWESEPGYCDVDSTGGRFNFSVK